MRESANDHILKEIYSAQQQINTDPQTARWPVIATFGEIKRLPCTNLLRDYLLPKNTIDSERQQDGGNSTIRQ